MKWSFMFIALPFVLFYIGCDKEPLPGTSCADEGLIDYDGVCPSKHDYDLMFYQKETETGYTLTIEIVRKFYHPDTNSNRSSVIKRGELAYDRAVEVNLSWSCQGGETGQTKATVPANSASVEPVLSGITVLGFVTCEFTAEANIPYFHHVHKEERTITVKRKEEIGIGFIDEKNNITLEFTNITPGDPDSTVDVKVSLLDNSGKLVKKGSSFFDEDVSGYIDWFCEKEGGSNTQTDEDGNVTATGEGKIVEYTIAAGSAEGVVQINLGFSHTAGDPALECSAKATASLQEQNEISSADTPFILGSLQLNVVVIKADLGKTLSYRVVENGTAVSDKVSLLLSPTPTECWDLRLIHFPSASTSINYGLTIDDLVSSDDVRLFLLEIRSPNAAGCSIELTATTGSGNNKKMGKSNKVEVAASPSPPFTLIKNDVHNPNYGAISATSAYTGKVWVYHYDSAKSSSDLVAYLNATNVTSATKLKASAAANAGDAELNASMTYIVFAEVNGVLHVFSM